MWRRTSEDPEAAPSTAGARVIRDMGISQRKRKRVEECVGWVKTVATLRKLRHRGIFKVGWVFTFAAAGLQPGAHAQSGRLAGPVRVASEKCA